jgi:hypothetical protein
VTRNALLGLALITFCVAGIVVGIVRVAPGSNTGDVGVAVVAAALGVAAFVVVLRVGRRGNPPWAKWLIVPALIAALYIDRLPERWQLALLALAGGYVGAFLASVIARAFRLTR